MKNNNKPRNKEKNIKECVKLMLIELKKKKITIRNSFKTIKQICKEE